MSARTLRLWRGDAAGGELVDYEVEVETGMVVLDAVLEIQRVAGARTWPCAGTARPPSAARAAPR